MANRYEAMFANLCMQLKCIKIYDHVPKPCREMVGNLMCSLLTGLCEDPRNLDHWIRLICFLPFVLMKPPRGGRRFNLANFIIKKIEHFQDSRC